MEVEQLDQQITLELQTIDNNILEISNILTSKIQPVVHEFNDKFQNILHNSTFHKQMFQTAGGLKDLSYMTIPTRREGDLAQLKEKKNKNKTTTTTNDDDGNVLEDNEQMSTKAKQYRSETDYNSNIDNTSDLVRNVPIPQSSRKDTEGIDMLYQQKEKEIENDGEGSLMRKQRKKRKMSLMIQQQFASSSDDDDEDNEGINDDSELGFKESTRHI